MLPDPTITPTLDVPTAAGLLGVSADLAYDLIRADQFPIEVLRLGRAIRVPTRPLLDKLGLLEAAADA